MSDIVSSNNSQTLKIILKNMLLTLDGMGSSDDVETLRLDAEKAMDILK